jgi:hypothetical protein
MPRENKAVYASLLNCKADRDRSATRSQMKIKTSLTQANDTNEDASIENILYNATKFSSRK